MSGNSPEAGGTPAGTVEPYARHHRFSARVLLTTVLILFALTLVFVFIRLLLYAFVPRSGGRGGLGAGILRSINSFGRIGSRRGLDASALSALPVTAYRKKESAAGASAGGGPDSDCAVCLSELTDGDKVRELPNCGHVFHVDCVDAWLRSTTTCPLCRAEAESGPKAEAAQSSATEPPPQPALFGAGGTLIVTVDGFPDGQRAAHGETSGLRQMVSSHT